MTINSDGHCREPWRSRWRPGGNVADNVKSSQALFFSEEKQERELSRAHDPAPYDL